MERVIQPVLDELRLQGTLGQPTEVMHVDGEARAPGGCLPESGTRVADLIRAGGGTGDGVSGRAAEFTATAPVPTFATHPLLKADLAADTHGYVKRCSPRQFR
jgi:hypothetical protein